MNQASTVETGSSLSGGFWPEQPLVDFVGNPHIVNRLESPIRLRLSLSAQDCEYALQWFSVFARTAMTRSVTLHPPLADPNA
jgi:hypothetical protein